MSSSEPTFARVPDAVESHWDEVSDLCAAYGLELNPWQESVLRIALGEREDGTWAASRVGLSVPRQSGKTALFEARELAGLLLYGEKLMIHSAHLVPTALEAFQRIKYYFESFDDLSKLVRRIREGNGDQSIEMMNGSRLLFKARARGAGRGFSADLLMLDEAQILGEREWAAMLPTMSARPNPQAWLAGTPPGLADDGAAFSKLRASAQGGLDTRLAWAEWSPPAGDVDVSDRALWSRTNPGMDFGRPALESVEDEFFSMDADTFARERLGKWDTLLHSRAFDPSAWNDLKGKAPAEGRVVYGVKFTADGSGVALAKAIRPDSGNVFVQPLEQRNLGEGIHWLVERLTEEASSAAQFVFDGKAGVGYLVNALRDAGVKNKRIIIIPTLEQYTAAHSMLEQAVIGKEMSHPGSPAFDAQVLDAVKRKIGNNGGFGWDPSEGETVVSLDAATLAFWGAKTTKRRPGGGTRMSI